PLNVVEALESGRAIMPCDITPPTYDDHPILVLFYRGATGTPIYSIDNRDGVLARAVHWSDQNDLQGRAFYDLASSALVMMPVQLADQTLYRCRVDFRDAPSRNTRIQLKVI
ncbi:unnamed protein product, partial [Meganyctiphanes norvegica]